jgi:predicted ATPase
MDLEAMDAFCGLNGSGKSSVFDAIRFVRDLAIGNCFLGSAGDESKRTVSKLEFCNWLKSNIQEFEVEFEEENHKYLYKLHIQQAADYEEPRIIQEVAFYDGTPLFTRDKSRIQLGKDKGFTLDWRQSALSVILPYKQIETLKKALENLIILRPNARLFENESRFESKYVNLDMSNIISWYRHHSQDQDWTDVLRQSLQTVWPEDFRSLKLSESGNSIKQLELRFSGGELNFSQLSDGEKMLVALYMLHAVMSTTKGSLTVLIDEPDNFVSIQELQPWLLEMDEVVSDMHQLLIISHNAEILESVSSQLHYFDRDNHSAPTRIKHLTVPEGLRIGEALARGWV